MREKNYLQNIIILAFLGFLVTSTFSIANVYFIPNYVVKDSNYTYKVIMSISGFGGLISETKSGFVIYKIDNYSSDNFTFTVTSFGNLFTYLKDENINPQKILLVYVNNGTYTINYNESLKFPSISFYLLQKIRENETIMVITTNAGSFYVYKINQSLSKNGEQGIVNLYVDNSSGLLIELNEYASDTLGSVNITFELYNFTQVLNSSNKNNTLSSTSFSKSNFANSSQLNLNNSLTYDSTSKNDNYLIAVAIVGVIIFSVLLFRNRFIKRKF